ncbi:hypothetical protein ACWELY_34915, partial [Streptomyces sp. NPDC004599]
VRSAWNQGSSGACSRATASIDVLVVQGGDLPGAAQPLPQAPDVCALGRQYGGWRGGSPESEICEQTYGR